MPKAAKTKPRTADKPAEKAEPEKAAPKTPFELFVSCVPGYVVARFGTMRPGLGNEQIGVTTDERGRPVWHPEIIVALTAQEVARYRREYARALRDKALRKRTEAEFLAFVEAGKNKQEPKGKSTEEK
jgi:hypothetical protein